MKTLKVKVQEAQQDDLISQLQEEVNSLPENELQEKAQKIYAQQERRKLYQQERNQRADVIAKRKIYQQRRNMMMKLIMQKVSK